MHTLVNGVLWWMFLTGVIGVREGSIAHALVLNGVANLFILEIDNLVSSFLLVGNLKTEFHDGSLEVTVPHRDERAMCWGRNALMLLTPIVTIVALTTFDYLEPFVAEMVHPFVPEGRSRETSTVLLSHTGNMSALLVFFTNWADTSARGSGRGTDSALQWVRRRLKVAAVSFVEVTFPLVLALMLMAGLRNGLTGLVG